MSNTSGHGGFITGSDFLMDGGVTAADWHGDPAEVRGQQADRAHRAEGNARRRRHLPCPSAPT